MDTPNITPLTLQIIDGFLFHRIDIFSSDNSDALYIDRQILIVDENGFYLGVMYCCTGCGLKNP